MHDLLNYYSGDYSNTKKCVWYNVTWKKSPDIWIDEYNLE